MLSKLLTSKGTLWGVLFFCSFEVLAQNWQDPQWQRLLIYRATLTGQESEADSQEFFLHKDGKSRPDLELKALISALDVEDSDPTKNAFCRFPARVRWLRKHRSVPISKVRCENYEKFRDRVAAKAVSVVFSSYYLNNPASSFGHTFLRLGKQANEVRDHDSTATELLDTGINYGALTDGAGPVVFAIGGLTGWFQGNYNAVPYYYKVREYNDFETRDLWSYQLDLSSEEIDLIVDHIWELGHTKFDYFFLTENCSYHVLSILEATRPTLKLHDRLPRLYTIPSETLKALNAEGLVRKVTFRPAPSTQFYHQLELLSQAERTEVRHLVDSGQRPETAAPRRRSLVYDAALSLVDYKYAKKILKGDEEAQALKRPLLIERSKIPVRSDDIDYSYKLARAPHLGHGQKRLGIGYVNRDGKTMGEIEGRFAFHDVLDIDVGYPPRTRLEVMKALVQTNGNEFQLRDLSVVDVLMLGKRDQFNKSPSWKVKMGQTQTRLGLKDLTTQGFSGGYGLSFDLGAITPYLLAHIETAYVSEYRQRLKLGYGADAAVISDIGEHWKMLNLLEARFGEWNETRLLNELRYSTSEYGAGAFHHSWPEDGSWETGLRLYRYL